MKLDTKSISILNKLGKTVTFPRFLTINHERQKPLFCLKTPTRQALELQVFRPESLQKNKSAQIFTGDKRFIKALAKVNLPIIQESLNHKLWCLEQLVLKNIEADGFETIKELIVPVRECDKAIKNIFGSGLKSTYENSLVTLKSYIEECRQEAGNLLNPYK